MSDAQKLTNAVNEYEKAKKALDDKLSKAQESIQQARQEQKDQQNR